MARHLARVADAQGMITGLSDVMRSYAAREHVSVQTGYTDLRRLVLRYCRRISNSGHKDRWPAHRCRQRVGNWFHGPISRHMKGYGTRSRN